MRDSEREKARERVIGILAHFQDLATNPATKRDVTPPGVDTKGKSRPPPSKAKSNGRTNING